MNWKKMFPIIIRLIVRSEEQQRETWTRRQNEFVPASDRPNNKQFKIVFFSPDFLCSIANNWKKFWRERKRRGVKTQSK